MRNIILTHLIFLFAITIRVVPQIPGYASKGLMTLSTLDVVVLPPGFKPKAVVHLNSAVAGNCILETTASNGRTLGSGWNRGDTDGVKGDSQNDFRELHFESFNKTADSGMKIRIGKGGGGASNE